MLISKTINSYRVTLDGGKLGVRYCYKDSVLNSGAPEWVEKEKTILKPAYSSLEIKNAKQDTDTLFLSKKEYIEKHNIKIQEDSCQIIEADGRHGLLYMGCIIPGLSFDSIIKLSYRHYLCRNRSDYTLYRFNNIGYETIETEDKKSKDYIIRMATIRFKTVPTLAILLNRLSQTCPAEYRDISERIRPYNSGNYVCEYDHFSGWVVSSHFTWAVKRVIMSNDFSVQPLDIKYGALAGEE